MQVRVTVVIQALQQWHTRLEAVTERQLRDPYFHERMEDLIVGCLDLLEYSPTLDVAAWLKRRPRRLALAEPSTAARTSAGRIAIQELVALTISDLDASAGFRPHVESGVLPMKAPRRATECQRQALDLGRHKLLQQRAQQDQRQAPRFLRTYAAHPISATGNTQALVGP